MKDTEILKHPDCPFDVIVRDDNALIRHKKTQSMEPANPQVVLMALLIKELTKSVESITGTLGAVELKEEMVVDETAPPPTGKILK